MVLLGENGLAVQPNSNANSHVLHPANPSPSPLRCVRTPCAHSRACAASSTSQRKASFLEFEATRSSSSEMDRRPPLSPRRPEWRNASAGAGCSSQATPDFDRTSWTIAVTLAVFAALLSNLGVNLQKLAWMKKLSLSMSPQLYRTVRCSFLWRHFPFSVSSGDSSPNTNSPKAPHEH